MNLREARRVVDMSQQDLANKCGISQGYVSMIERGSWLPRNKKVQGKIETALGMPVGSIEFRRKRRGGRKDGN
jgi:transcriptional regulator with XRE-family HTH domain